VCKVLYKDSSFSLVQVKVQIGWASGLFKGTQYIYLTQGCRGRDCMVVGFTTTCAIGVYHHYSCDFEPRSWRGVSHTTLCDKVCQWLATGLWFSPGTLVSSTNKTDHHDIVEIVLKVVLNTINLNHLSIIVIVERPLHPSECLLDVVMSWCNWDDEYKKTTHLVLKSAERLIQLDEVVSCIFVVCM
jgi:hypothetical protein